MSENMGASKKALPLTVSYSYVCFDGTLQDKETIDLIFFYLEQAGGPVNVKIEGRVITIYPGDNEAWLERRHHEASFMAIQAIIGKDRRKKNLGHAPEPLLPPEEPSE